MTTRAYIRLSTGEQDEASQRHQLNTWTEQTGRTIDETVTDYASGGIKWQERGLAALLAKSEPGDTIVVSEISRIARSIVGVMSFLEDAANAEVGVVAIAQGLTLDGSIMGKMAAAIFGIAAEIDRYLLRSRTKAALAARKKAGMPLGRPKGSKGISKCASHAEEIDRLLAAKVSKKAIARIIGCAPNTLNAYLRNPHAPTKDTRTGDIFATAEPNDTTTEN